MKDSVGKQIRLSSQDRSTEQADSINAEKISEFIHERENKKLFHIPDDFDNSEEHVESTEDEQPLSSIIEQSLPNVSENKKFVEGHSSFKNFISFGQEVIRSQKL